ncbi:40S ribosomal protein S10 [Eumeta japonica]|uniref:40S ribosomal protein S10 n=1 Tax=Eumeta variegata TaxID=151549 RepID=A0A4C1TT74_EUMVA|nr:40S ribosomal protein S10 [Eumeta japonica]
MIKRSVFAERYNFYRAEQRPGKIWRWAARDEGKRTLIHGRCWQDNIRGSDGAGPVRARVRAAAGDSGGASSVGGVFALKTATGGQGAPLESASSGGGGARSTSEARRWHFQCSVFRVGMRITMQKSVDLRTTSVISAKKGICDACVGRRETPGLPTIWRQSLREMLKNRVAIYEYLFKEGVMVAKKDYHAPKHPDLEKIPNLQVIKAMQSLKSRGYVKEQFAWRHFYWYLTNEGIEYLRIFLHLPPEIVPATLKRSVRIDPVRRGAAGRPDAPARSAEDRSAYRRTPAAPPTHDKKADVGPGSADVEFSKIEEATWCCNAELHSAVVCSTIIRKRGYLTVSTGSFFVNCAAPRPQSDGGRAERGARVHVRVRRSRVRSPAASRIS